MNYRLFILLSTILYFSKALRFAEPGSLPDTVFENQRLNFMVIGDNTFESLGDYTDTYLTHPESRVIISPRHKLAFCWIEKNACSQFNKLFNEITGKKGTRGHPWGASAAQVFHLSLANLTQENGWRWATFFRDPVKRYASAFQSKCLVKEDDGKACEPRDAIVYKTSVSADMPARIIKQFEYSVHHNANRTYKAKRNPHYGNQIDFCGGVHSRHYDFIGLLEGNIDEQVQHMLQEFGVEGSAELASKFFPARAAGHKSPMPASQLYRDDYVKSKVISMYEADIKFVEEIRSKSMVEPQKSIQLR